MHVHPKHPYISASPDGIFTCQCHEINRLVEAKCPYSKCEAGTQILYPNTNPIVNLQECEFIIWTPHHN